MDEHQLRYLKDLNARLQARGFSWHHNDYFMLQEVLPEILRFVQPEDSGKCPMCGALTWPDGNELDYTP